MFYRHSQATSQNGIVDAMDCGNALPRAGLGVEAILKEGSL